MIDFVGFSDGYRKQQDTGERKRLELAKAFQEFQRQNPTANPMEFQAFIDSMAGGSNYLRGGMPSGDMLKAITDRADTRRAQALKEQEFANFKNSVEAQESIKGAVTGIMLDYADPGDSGYEQKDFTAMADSLKERFPNVDFENMGIDVNSMFSPQLRQTAIADRIGNYLPKVTAFIKNSGGKNITASDLQKMGVPTAFVTPLLNQAKVLDDELRDEFARKRKAEMLGVAQKLILAENPNIHEALVEMFGSENVPKSDSVFITSLVAEATDNANRTKLERTREAKQLVDTFVSGLVDSKSMKSSIVLQDDKETLSYIVSRLNGMAPEDIQTIFGADATLKKITDNPEAYLGDYVAQVRQELRLQQRGLASTERASVNDQVLAAQKTLIDQNLAQAEAYFGNPTKDKGPESVGFTGQKGAYAASILAQEYEMTPAVLAAIENVFSQVQEGESTNAIMLIDMVKKDAGFQSVTKGRTLRDAKDRLNSTLKNTLASPEIQTFDNWMNGELEQIQATAPDAKQKIEQAAQIYADDPETLLTYLRNFATEVTSVTNQTRSRWDMLRRQQKEANGGMGWLDIEGGVWDDAKVATLDDTLNSSMAEISDLLQTQISMAEQAILESLKTDPEVNNSGINPDGSTVNQRENQVEDVIGNRLGKIRETFKQTSLDTSFYGKRTVEQSDEEFMDKKALNAFLFNLGGDMNDAVNIFWLGDSSGPEGIGRVIAEDMDEYTAFLRDPYEYMKQYKGGGWYRSWLERNQ
jgi:hypothetical protein